jgi:hypothetical protein
MRTMRETERQKSGHVSLVGGVGFVTGWCWEEWWRRGRRSSSLERAIRRGMVVSCSPPVLVGVACVLLQLGVAELGVRSVEAFVQWGTFTVAYVLLMLVPCSALCLHLVLLP